MEREKNYLWQLTGPNGETAYIHTDTAGPLGESVDTARTLGLPPEYRWACRVQEIQPNEEYTLRYSRDIYACCMIDAEIAADPRRRDPFSALYHLTLIDRATDEEINDQHHTTISLPAYCRRCDSLIYSHIGKCPECANPKLSV